MSVQITFLNHSGFAVETDSKVLVFDYYKDPSGTVKAYSHVARSRCGSLSAIGMKTISTAASASLAAPSTSSMKMCI